MLYEIKEGRERMGVNLDLIEFYRCNGDLVVIQVNGVKQEILFNTPKDADNFINMLNKEK